MSDLNYIHLRVHSAYSLSKGAIKVTDLPPLCKRFNMPALAITDLNNLFGVMDLAKTCASAGIQHIIGIQITLKHVLKTGISLYAPIILLVQNQTGYKNLVKLSTKSYQHPMLSTEGPFITLEQLDEHSEGIICLTGGETGPWGKLLLQKDFKEANNLLLHFQELFDNRFYIEIMRHGLQDQAILEPQFLDIALKNNIPIVATNDVYFADPSMFEAHDILLCISEGRYISEENREKSSPHKYFKSQEEMKALFADLPEALENTIHIAQRCHFLLEERDPILPPFQTESGLPEKEELQIQAVSGLAKRLEQQVFPSCKDQTPETLERLKSEYQARLEMELNVVNSMGFPGYFLIVSDFIKWAKQHNIPVGPGRGSGAGSLVAWSLTITDIDPLRFDLIFERFLNPERVSMPDFDVDFCQDRRSEVIDYVLDKYGQEKVAQIITFGKLQARAVLRDVGRVLEMPYNQVDKVCKLIPNNPSHLLTLNEAIESDIKFRELIRADETVAKLVDIGLKLEGLYRHASTHAAGVVIGGQDLSDVVPLYYDGESPLAITQINMKYIEKAGLLKFDFLGLKTLTVIQNCCNLIRQRGVEINISTIPLDDKKTFELLCNINVLGVFQLESGGMQDVLKKLRPDRLEDLIALVALYRPGPMDDIPKYLARKHGEEPVTYLHPKLEPILSKTYGVMVYQEQVMQIAQVLGGYTLGGADLLRRAMGKKNKEEMTRQRTIFIQGAIKNNIKEDIAVQVFDLMAKFASYGFNKSHSAPYALISYQTAYLKANYPLEFFAATVSYEKNNIEKMVSFFQDLKKNGFKLLSPDINQSDVNFIPENGALRYALSAIKNVGEQAMISLITERRKNGPFKSLEDFASRINPSVINKRQIENLIASGAFDCLHPNRKQLFESADIILSYANSCKQEQMQSMRSLFGESSQTITPLRLNPTTTDWNILEKSQKEFEALGFYLNNHPLDIYQDIIHNLKLQNSSNFEQIIVTSNTIICCAAIILSKEERSSRNGQKFAFITFSDQHGMFEIPFFSENYARVREWIEPGLAVYLEVLAKRNDDGSIRMTGQTIELLNTKVKNQPFCLEITENSDIDQLNEVLNSIQNTSEENLYKCQICLFLNISNQRVKITLPSTYCIDAKTKAEILSIRHIKIYEQPLNNE